MEGKNACSEELYDMRHLPNFIVIFIIYILILFFYSPRIFTYQVSDELTEKYLRSQDIPHEVNGRVFLSDSEIHIAAAKQYALGADPTSYNFQHPPFVKYLYGISYLISGNPFFAQIILGAILLSGTYLISFSLFKKKTIALFSAVALSFDTLFIDLSSNAMLDLGQATFLIWYIYYFLFKKDSNLFKGVLLGLIISSKFWALPLFVLIFLCFFKFQEITKNYRNFILHLFIAGFVFFLMYAPTFVTKDLEFNFIFYQLKTLKYWLDHSITSVLGGSLFLFITGYFKTWWGDLNFVKTSTWSYIWPIMLTFNFINIYNIFFKKSFMSNTSIINFFPLVY